MRSSATFRSLDVTSNLLSSDNPAAEKRKKLEYRLWRKREAERGLTQSPRELTNAGSSV